MLKATLKLFKAVDLISELSGKVIRYLILFVFIIVVYDVTLRYAFNASTVWANEIATYFFGAGAALGGAYVLKHGGHVKMDLVYNRLSLRQKAIVDACTAAFFFLFIAVFVWVGGDRALSATLRFERSGSVFNSPLWPFLWVLPVGAGLMGLQGIAGFIRNVFLAVTGKELE